MKAILYDNASPLGTLKLEDIEKPTPDDDEVLVMVRAASVNPFDSHSLRHPFLRRIMTVISRRKSSRPGRDVAGEVEAVGKNVTKFKPGDTVFGLCGGAFAEYACVSHSALVMKPANASFEQAASVPMAGLTALQGLRDKGNIQPGQKVLINGAAGGVGTFAVQIAKSFGAEVTAVCSTRNLEMVRSIGADHVVDYTREDFTKIRRRSGQHYDLIFDLISNHSFRSRWRALNPRGIYIGAGVLARSSIMGLLLRLITDLVLSCFVSQKFVTLTARITKDDLTVLAELMKVGKVTPVIDRCYSLSETLEAIRYVEQKHARGKVIITLEHLNPSIR